MGYSSYPTQSYFQPIPENSSNMKKRSFDMSSSVSSIPVYQRHNSHNGHNMSHESNWNSGIGGGELAYSEPPTPGLLSTEGHWTFGSDTASSLQDMKLESFDPTLDMTSLVSSSLPKQENFGLLFPFDDFECRNGSLEQSSNLHQQNQPLQRTHSSASLNSYSQSFPSIHDSPMSTQSGLMSSSMEELPYYQRQLKNIQFNRLRMVSENHSDFGSSLASPADSGFCTPIDSYASSPILNHPNTNSRSYFNAEYMDHHRRPSITTGLQSLHMADELSLDASLSMAQASSSLSTSLSVNQFLDTNQDLSGSLIHQSDTLDYVPGHFYNDKLHLDHHPTFSTNPSHEEIMNGTQTATYHGFHDGAPPTLSPPSSPNTENGNTPVSPTDGINYPLDTKLELNGSSTLKPVVHSYISSPNSLMNGEKTVVILTSKVAQKSYGTEKRFLCPPPTVLLLGQNWRTNAFNKSGSSADNSTVASPKLTIGIPGESGQQQGILEWSGPSSPSMDSSTMESSSVGRCVAKHLFINDADEKRKRVEVLVNVQSSAGHAMGTFVSKPIKVISKPSKKRQSVKNMELCIHHGTTISLFNRIRSQTVSTKYLGVSTPSSSSSAFGTAKWPSNMNNNNSSSDSACFVARTGRWDPFVIWLVDLNRRNAASEQNVTPPPPGFPAPPTIAVHPQEYSMSFSPGSDPRVGSDGKTPIPIHYNQPVVLQCLSTGLISPVMIIRKVDKGSLVVGNGTGTGREEMLGDPVSQLHKVAFQIVEDVSEEENPFPVRSSAGSYLVCLGDVVGVQRSNEGRKFDLPSNQKPLSRSDSLPNVLENTEGWQNSPFESASNGAVSGEGENGSRKRRALSITNNAPLVKAAKGGRRNSVRDDLFSNGECTSPNIWSEDVSDTAVWTIVGTDCVQYSFYTPNSTLGNESTVNPITPIPFITHVAPSTQNVGPNVLTIYGENLTPDLSVWFGEIQSKITEFKSRESAICTLPSPGQNGVTEGTPLPILLVRSDGVVYKTGKFYTV